IGRRGERHRHALHLMTASVLEQDGERRGVHSSNSGSLRAARLNRERGWYAGWLEQHPDAVTCAAGHDDIRLAVAVQILGHYRLWGSHGEVRQRSLELPISIADQQYQRIVEAIRDGEIERAILIEVCGCDACRPITRRE